MKYVVYCDGARPMEMFVNTIEEAMVAFDRMTFMYNHFNNGQYLTCEEMGVSTIEDFIMEVIDSTDCIYCDTLENYHLLINESFMDEWENFEKNYLTTEIECVIIETIQEERN